MTPADLRAARLALGLSVKEMAEALGITPGHVRRLETPENRVRHRRVQPWMVKSLERLSISLERLSSLSRPP